MPGSDTQEYNYLKASPENSFLYGNIPSWSGATVVIAICLIGLFHRTHVTAIHSFTAFWIRVQSAEVKG